MMSRIVPTLGLAALLSLSLVGRTIAQGGAPTATTGSQNCAILAQAAADGLSARIAADDRSINPPQSVTRLSCLQGFFNGVGLDVITNFLNPGNLLAAVEGQICAAVNTAWQSAIGTAQCGLTVTGFNTGFGLGLGGGAMCPRLSFGGGGPPLGSINTGYTQSGTGLYFNGAPTAPTGYPIVQPGSVY